jgi:putative oxidoreductase
MQTGLKQKSLWIRIGSVDKTSQKLYQAIVIIRILVACVFLSEGIQKFLFSDALGAGRFMKIGIPFPEIMAPFVGIVEIACGGLILMGLFTRLAALPLIINMFVAIFTTKIPILFEKGFWAMAHEARVDWSMILGLLFLFIVGSGQWSLDDIRDRDAKN